MSYFKNNAAIKTIKTRSNLKSETERPTKVYSSIPKVFEGVDGEQRLVNTGKNKYLYSKMNGMWFKTLLKQPSESDVTTSTSGASDSGSGGGGTTGNPITVVFNYTYDTGDGSQYLKGWLNYLEACKETEASGHTVTTKSEWAHNGLANGSFLKEGQAINSDLVIPEGLSQPSSGYHYFSTEQIGGTNSYYLFRLDYAGELTGVRGRSPSAISCTESGTTSSDEITVAVTGNVEISESVRIYWKVASAGSYGANDYVTINTSGTTSTSWSDTYTFNASNSGLTPSASTSYKFKTEPRNTASQQNVGQTTESETITTPSSAGGWSVPSDFEIAAFGEGSIGNFHYESRTATLTNGNTGTNSSTVSWTKDSGSCQDPGFAISKDGDPGVSGTDNNGTGWNNGNSTSKSIDLGSSSATLYIRFRHRFRSSHIGNDANFSVTFSNTSSNVADNTDLDITMSNASGQLP